VSGVDTGETAKGTWVLLMVFAYPVRGSLLDEQRWGTIAIDRLRAGLQAGDCVTMILVPIVVP
jgi:hypothetical protein